MFLYLDYPLSLDSDLKHIYSASMKGYQYPNFDILENIHYSSTATFTFMLMVNDILVLRQKSVQRVLEL